MRRLAMSVIGVVCATAASASDVFLELDSPQNGGLVPLGSTLDWSIFVTVSTGDNIGLSLVIVDLEQDRINNPRAFDIPPGLESSIVPPMDQFSKPKGVSNPGFGSFSTGYVGTPTGTIGARNLRQIGGGQNTFGTPGPGNIGQDADVEAGIGQSGPALVLSGRMTLPNDPLAVGTYTFSLTNAVANTLVEVRPRPEFSLVDAANVDLSAGTISVTMVPEPATVMIFALAAGRLILRRT